MGDPLFSGMPWASDDSYPAGGHGWSSQPTKIVPSYSFFSPSKPLAPSAPEFNALFNQRDLALLRVREKTRYTEALNFPLGELPWSAAISDFDAVSWYPPAWDAYSCRWLVGARLATGPVNVVYQSTDGSTWRQCGTGFDNLIDDIAIRASDGLAVAVQVEARKTSRLLSPSGTTWGLTVVNAGGGTSPGKSTIACFGNRFLLAYGIDGSATPTFLHANDGHTWTAVTGTTIGALGANTKGGTFVVGASVALFFGIISGNTSGSLGTTYCTTADGIAWTRRTLPTFATGDEVVMDACYDAISGTFYLLYTDPVWNSGLGSSRILSSTDGVTWDLSRPDIPRAMTALACNGPLLASYIINVSGGLDRMIVSGDDALTWAGANLGRATSSAGAKLRASGTQFMFHDRVNDHFGYSEMIGAPPTLRF